MKKKSICGLGANGCFAEIVFCCYFIPIFSINIAGILV